MAKVLVSYCELVFAVAETGVGLDLNHDLSDNEQGLVPPCAPTEDVVSDFEEELSGSMEHCEFGVLILPRKCPSSSSTDEIPQPPNEALLPCDLLPLNLAEITADSRERPDQALIDRIDGVSSSAFQHLSARLTCIPDAGRRDMRSRPVRVAQHLVQDV